MGKTLTIAVCTVFQDAGEATRSMGIAKGIMEYKPAGVNVRIVFLSRGSKFEQRAIDCGFEIFKANPPMSGVGMHQDLKPDFRRNELVGEPEIAYELLKGEIEAYEKIKPDLVLYGFWPFAGLARRMVTRQIPGICFIPLPLNERLFDVIPDAPERIKLLSYLPHKLRRFIIRSVPVFIRRRLPFLRQRNIIAAANRFGWKGKKLFNVLDMLSADLTIVNDLPLFYEGGRFPDSFQITGPLFHKSNADEKISDSIRNVFDAADKKVKIFCTLGSSGTKKQLMEVVKVFTYGEGLKWNAVILSPLSVCPIEEARAALGNRKGVYITDEFVPAPYVNSLADVVVCHGGQGTVQTALCCGTPITGVAMQPEQQINLDHVAEYGAGIRIPLAKWNAERIQKGICRILADKSYCENALKLKEKIEASNGVKNSAVAIWKFIGERIK